MIIGITGKARAGKDTVADLIKSRLGDRCHTIAFAKPIKDFCKRMFDWNDEQVYGFLKEAKDRRYKREDGSFLTPREAMQTLGTEWGRRVYKDVWIDYALRQARRWLSHGDLGKTLPPLREFDNGQWKMVGWEDGTVLREDRRRFVVHMTYLREHVPGTVLLDMRNQQAVRICSTGRVSGPSGLSAWIDVEICEARVVVVTDCRFVNEASAIRDAGGSVWEIRRTDSGLSGQRGQHTSEQEHATAEFQSLVSRVIDNNETLAQLRQSVGEALQELGLA